MILLASVKFIFRITRIGFDKNKIKKEQTSPLKSMGKLELIGSLQISMLAFEDGRIG